MHQKLFDGRAVPRSPLSLQCSLIIFNLLSVFGATQMAPRRK